MPKIIFETQRLIGRHIESDDLDEMLVVYGDLDAMKWVDDGTTLTREDAVRWIEKTRRNYETQGYGLSALMERTTGVLVGFCGISHPGDQVEAEIKYTLKRSYWGQGLATEAVRAMIDHADNDLGIRHIIATTAPENRASHRVLLKSGLILGELRNHEDGTATQYFEWRSARPALES